ncbi:unnamed protein product [Arctogadus glacialis]
MVLQIFPPRKEMCQDIHHAGSMSPTPDAVGEKYADTTFRSVAPPKVTSSLEPEPCISTPPAVPRCHRPATEPGGHGARGPRRPASATARAKDNKTGFH